MKASTLILAVALVSGTLYAKEKMMMIDKNLVKESLKMTTVHNGVVSQKNVYVMKVSTKSAAAKNAVEYFLPNGNKFNSKSEIMVKFKKGEKVDIDAIEQKYQLKLIRKMTSGDYLFKNIGGNTLDTINTFLKDEASKVERISPDMILNMKPL
jgi:hypothetical protein